MVHFQKYFKIGILFFLCSIVSTSVLGGSSSNIKIEYVSVMPDREYQFRNNDIYIISLKALRYEHPITIENSRIFNLNASRVRSIKFLKVSDSTFYFAKLPGILLEDCKFKNVKFVSSDLSFLKFKNCELENVTYERSVTYGLK